MHTSRKRREDEGATETARPQEPLRASSPAEQVLALQRSAGNQAVARTLAIARETKPAPPKAGEEGRKSAASIEISELGTIDLESVQMQQHMRPGGTGNGRGEEREKKRMAITATMRLSDKAAELQRAALHGKVFETVLIRVGSVSVSMKNVLVTSVSVSGAGTGEEIMSFSLDGEEPEFKQEKQAEGS